MSERTDFPVKRPKLKTDDLTCLLGSDFGLFH